MKTTSLLLAAVTLTSGGCASTPVPSHPAANGADVVRRIYEEAINGAKPELLADLVASDYVGPTGERGPSGFAANVDGVRAGFPDIRFHIEEIVDGGDRVAVRWTWQGTHTGSFRGNAPTGKRVTNSGIAIYELRDGKAVRSHLETDRLGVLQALGLAPSPGAPPSPSP